MLWNALLHALEGMVIAWTEMHETTMTESILSRLLDMTKQRRAAFDKFCEGGSLCHGNLYWIELWEIPIPRIS